MRTDEDYDFAKDFGEGDLADPIPVRPFDDSQLQTLKQGLDDLYFNIGAVDAPRGPILTALFSSVGGTTERPTPQGPVVQPLPGGQPIPGGPPAPGGQPGAGQPGAGLPSPPRPPAPQGGRVIPCDNIIIDESDGGNGRPPGQGPGPDGLRNGPKIIEIPPGLKNCVFTQHHQADNGDNWVVIVRIQNGRMKQVVVIDENGNRTPVHRNVGQIIKVHKDNNKITVVGTRRSCTYFIKSNRLLCVP